MMVRKTASDVPRQRRKPSIVVLGGGTGTSTTLKGLEPFADDIDLTAVLSVADSGGSSGRLREAHGDLPWGDFVKCLLALSRRARRQPSVRDYWEYRFNDGHRRGNLILSDRRRKCGGDSIKALEWAHERLEVAGRILPVASGPVHLVGEDARGDIISGEHVIDVHPHAIREPFLSPNYGATKSAVTAIKEADVLVLGPGDWLTSVLPVLLVRGVWDAMKASRARIVFVLNLCNKPGPTAKWRAAKYRWMIKRYVPRLHCTVVNDAAFPAETLARYRAAGEEPVVDNLPERPNVIRTPLLDPRRAVIVPNDQLKRSVFRHDPQALACVLVSLLPETAFAACEAHPLRT